MKDEEIEKLENDGGMDGRMDGRMVGWNGWQLKNH